MAQLVQKTSFAGGEIDQALLERQNIQKVATGLEVARNMWIGKNALFERRKGLKYYKGAKANTGNTKLFSVPYSDQVLELTEDNIRIHNTSTGTYSDVAATATQLADALIPYVNLTYANKFLRSYGGTYFRTTSPCVYLFGMGGNAVKVLALDNALVDPTAGIPVPLGYFLQAANYVVGTNQDLDSGGGTQAITGTANEVEYCATVVTEDGEESVSYIAWLLSTAPAQLKQPTTAGDYVELTVSTDVTNLPHVTVAPLEFRFYRRPKSAGAFGYVGSAFEMTAVAGGFTAKFRDLGQAADFTKNPPTYITNSATFNPKVGLMTGGRMLYGNIPAINKEYIMASRPNFPWNLSRSYPPSDDSALLFKSGQSGAAEVLHMVDMGTVVVFTSVGIFTQSQRGPLTPGSAVLTFVNGSIADSRIPPIKLGDLLLFYDGSVKAIDFSNQRQNYTVEDISDFSGHLFKDKTITSWATVKRNNTDILFAVMDDGTFLTYVHNPKQELEAWTRHDFYDGDAIAVCGDISNTKLLFVVERDGVRSLEYLGDELFDSYVTKSINMAASLGYPLADLEWFFTALGPDGFDGDIRLDTTNPTTAYGAGFAVGKIYRMFDSNGDAYDIECTSIPGLYQVIFSIYQSNYQTLPVELRTDPNIWETFTEVTGLDHLNGKHVGVSVDDSVTSSPLNTDLNLPDAVPLAGSLTVPRAAFATVGLPYVSDIGTTDIKSTQDLKIAVSSRLSGKIYCKTDSDSKIFYAGGYFGADDTLAGMKRSEEMFVNTNKRSLRVRTFETTLVADWNNGGRVCLRVVDPVEFRLLSITTAVNIS